MPSILPRDDEERDDRSDPIDPSDPSEAEGTDVGLPSALERLRGVTGDGRRFRFVAEPARSVYYLAILQALLERRRRHEVEVYHDDLRDDVTARISDHLGERYDPLQFRADVEQLAAWGNLTERVEPTRIRSLADRTRSKLLLRLETSTVAFLEFLESEADPLPLGVRDQGANLLLDVHSALKEAAQRLESARTMLAHQSGPDGERPVPKPGEESAFAGELLRATYLVHEADAKADRAAGELVRFGDTLVRFVTEPFRVRELATLSSLLERYIDRYLTVLDERSRGVRRSLGRLENPDLLSLLQEAERIERDRMAEVAELVARPIRLRPAQTIIASLRTFFDPGTGLAEQCRRLNRRTRDAIRRIQRHVEAVRLRNIRMELIRARIGELFSRPGDSAADAAAFRFIDDLVAAVAIRMDARPGTPQAKSSPPRPARRYESLRQAMRNAPLAEKRDRPGESRELERLRLDRLSRFIEERVLRGRAEARFSDAHLRNIEDGALLVRAILAYVLRDGRARKYLRYILARMNDGSRAEIDAPDHHLSVPEALVRRASR